MLALDLERAIRQAWLNLRPRILSDPQELHRRLARRRSKSLTRPPRAWCIAIRASDRRITPAHWVISPEHAMDLNHPAHPYEPIEHEVTIQPHAIRRTCHPICFSREQAVNVAKMLGISDAMLLYHRRRKRFYTTYIRGLGGKRGHPVPLLDGGPDLLDPGHHSFTRPHPIWGGSWEFFSRMLPPDFQQTITRIPVFRPASRKGIPATEPTEKEDFRLRGYRWLCPMCKKPAATIYYPLPIRTLFDSWFTDPVIQKRLCDADLPPEPPPTFACMRCHRITYFSSIKHDAWNQVITYLSAGLLYGHEVEKPASFIPKRQRTRTRHLNRTAPQREKVFERLRLRLSPFQIARDLGKSLNAVKCAIRQICIQEGVKNLQALAQKLQFPLAPSLTYPQRAALRRPVILEMLLRDCTHEEMSKALKIDHPVLQKDILAIYQQHGIKGQPHHSRRELADNLGVPFVSRREEFPCPPEEIHVRIKQLRETGMKWKDIAREMGVSEAKMSSYRVMLSRSKKNAHGTSSVGPALPQNPPIASVRVP